MYYDYNNGEKKNLYAWGNGAFGQLGNSEENLKQFTPIKVLENNTDITNIYAKYFNSFALLNNKSILAWGRTNHGSLGKQLKGLNINTPKLFIDNLNKDNNNEEHIISLSINQEHGGIVTNTGKVYTWGIDFEGRLGNQGLYYKQNYKNRRDVLDKKKSSNNINSSNYNEIILPEAYKDLKFKEISCGATYTILLSTEGKLYSFGSNNEGCLGNEQEHYLTNNIKTKANKNDENKNPDNFSEISYFNNNDIKIKKVLSGSFYSCALSITNNLYCWGKNDYGQLGIGSTEYKSYVPKKVILNDEIEDFDIGEEHTGVISNKKELFLWGFGFDGRLCNGKETNFNVPSKVDIKGVNKISLGGQHTIILDSNNDVYTCGNGRDGELGRGNMIESSVSNRNIPMKIDYFNTIHEKVVDVKCGKRHTLVLTELINNLL